MKKSFLIVLLTGIFCMSVFSGEIVVHSLQDLYRYLNEDGNTVRLTPGVYKIRDFLNDDSITHRVARCEREYINFRGSNNTFIFEGVTFEIDTELRRLLRHPIHTNEMVITGNFNTLKGLTIIHTGNTTSPGGATFCAEGRNNTIRDFTLHVSGSFPYGYGDLFGKGGPDVIRHQKQSAFLVNGSYTKVYNTTLYMRSFGHGFYIQKGASDLHFENCLVEGEVRTTDDMLKETEGPAFDVNFRTVMPNRNGEYIVTPGYMKSLCEDGFRTYNSDNRNISLINCTAINTRSGFELRTRGGGIRLENCTTVGVERGYWVSDGAVLINCKGDAKYGPLLFLEGNDAKVELYVVAAESDRTVHSLATIHGNNNRVIFRLYNEQNRKQQIPILVGYRQPAAGESMSPYGEALCENLELVNETTMPVVLGKEAKNCNITTVTQQTPQSQNTKQKGDKIADKPLFRDPVYDGAADPTIVWNKKEKIWYMIYTNRHAADESLTGVSWVHGRHLGIATSKDGATWKYKGTANIDYNLVAEPVYWAPDVIEHKGVYHMYLTIVPGVFNNWAPPRSIAHLTSKDLVNWKYQSTLELCSNKVIDAYVIKMRDGLWRMWYNDETRGKAIAYAESNNLYHWTDYGIIPGFSRCEGPAVFHWKGKYRMIIDEWKGLAVYASDDAFKWTKQENNILQHPGKGLDDMVIGQHCDVVVQGDRAWVFYFTHPGRKARGKNR